jgi:hypothetical protein
MRWSPVVVAWLAFTAHAHEYHSHHHHQHTVSLQISGDGEGWASRGEVHQDQPHHFHHTPHPLMLTNGDDKLPANDLRSLLVRMNPGM